MKSSKLPQNPSSIWMCLLEQGMFSEAKAEEKWGPTAFTKEGEIMLIRYTMHPMTQVTLYICVLFIPDLCE